MPEKEKNEGLPEEELNRPEKEAAEKAEVAEGSLEETEKQRREVLESRKKPTAETAEAQKDRAGETLQKSAEEEEIALEKELLREQIEQGGIQLTEEEINGLYESIPDLVEGVGPEFSEYIGGMLPRMQEALDAAEKFKREGNEYKAVETLGDFLGKEMDGMEKIKDQHTREQIMSFIGSTIDIDTVVADMKKQTTVDGATEVAKIVPVVGPCIDLTEAARGRSAAGEKLSGGQRVKRAALGTAFMVMDVAGLVTAGSTTAVRAGITAAKAGATTAEVAKAASGAYKAAKAAEKVGKTASLAAKGARIGKSVTRFAALCRKTTKLNRVSRAVFKVGKLIQKYPRLAALVAKTIQTRSKYKGLREKTRIAGKAVRAARLTRASTEAAAARESFNRASKIREESVAPASGSAESSASNPASSSASNPAESAADESAAA